MRGCNDSTLPPPPTPMNRTAAYYAAALLAAPACMTAHAASSYEDCLNRNIELVNEVSTILERVTPATTGEAVAKLEALKPAIDAVHAELNEFPDDVQAATLSKPHVMQKLAMAMQRLFNVLQRLEKAAQEAAPDEVAGLQQVLSATHALMGGQE